MCWFYRSPFPIGPLPKNALDVGIKGAAWKKLVIFLTTPYTAYFYNFVFYLIFLWNVL